MKKYMLEVVYGTWYTDETVLWERGFIFKSKEEFKRSEAGVKYISVIECEVISSFESIKRGGVIESWAKVNIGLTGDIKITNVLESELFGTRPEAWEYAMKEYPEVFQRGEA